MVPQIRVERVVGRGVDDSGIGHDNKRCAVIAAVIRRLYVWIRILDKAAALVKALSASGNIVLRRIDLEDDRLAAVDKERQCRLSVSLAAQLRQDAEMLDIEKILRLPV